MAIAKIEPVLKFDLGTKMVPWKQRHAEGKELRRAIPRESHAQWKPGKNRPDPLKLLAISNKGRQAHLVPLRMGVRRNPRPSPRADGRSGARCRLLR
ncbi:MAG: hypothetical protein WA830_23490 [Candidatus Sulfotelmatobacter sp.]